VRLLAEIAEQGGHRGFGERAALRKPAEVRRLRIGYLINMIHAVLAIAEERLGKGEAMPGEIELTASNLIDMFASALTAPLSADTLGLLAPAAAEQ